ncbi:MAG: hypothetical protein HQK66_14870, partial [Desulfamplus sp.]|nr:hypothetical protein [Desulfamplus sp.]
MENGEWRMENGEWRMENGAIIKIGKKEGVALLLSLLLFLPLLALLTGIGGIDDQAFFNQEKRERNKLVNLSMKTFPRTIDAWFEDSYGLRRGMISLDALFNYFFSGRSINPSRVLVGKENFLFLGDSYEQVVMQSMNVINFTDGQLAFMVDILKSIKEKVNASGAKFYVTVAPNKHSIYPEYLPGRLIPNDRRTNVYDQFAAALTTTDINFIDLMYILKGAKTRYDSLYYKTDSHWSNLGAFIA